MDFKFIGAGSAGTPPYIKPVLSAYSRLQERPSLQPGALVDRARALLMERYGVAGGEGEAAFAHGVTGLVSEHTHYFDGFALLMPLPQGTAVAVRRAAGQASRVVFDGEDRDWALGDEAAGADALPLWGCVVDALARRLAPGEAVEAAVVSTVRAASADGYLAALGMATVRALQALFALPQGTSELVRTVADVIAACRGYAFSVAYPLAADAGVARAFLLVDTATAEYLALDLPPFDTLGWGLVDTGVGMLRSPAFFQPRKERAEAALQRLRQRGFPRLTSFRDLEHRDLQRALDDLPARYRGVVRHLVTQNRRVQRMVFAIRQADWQMFGALMLMAHASLREDWEGSHPRADFVVQQVRDMSIDGMYGASMTDAGGTVLVAGQPFIVPHSLDRIQEAVQERFGIVPDVELL